MVSRGLNRSVLLAPVVNLAHGNTAVHGQRPVTSVPQYLSTLSSHIQLLGCIHKHDVMVTQRALPKPACKAPEQASQPAFVVSNECQKINGQHTNCRKTPILLTRPD